MLRQLSLTCLCVALAATGVSASDIIVAGRGGNDKAIFHALLTDVLREDFARLGVNVRYQPVEANYNQFLLNALSSGTAPDVFYVEASMIDVLARSGRLAHYPQSLVQAAGMVDLLRDSFTVNSRVYALPKDFNSYALLYNKDVFDDAGVSYPSEADDYFTFREKLAGVVAELAEEGVTGLCMNAGYSTGFAPFVLGTGWQPFNAEGRTVLDGNFERGFRYYVGLLRDGLATMSIDLGHTWSGGCFGAERAAVAIEGNWISRYLRDKAPNLLFGAVPPPRDPVSGRRGNLIFSVGWGISETTQSLQLARQVVGLLTSNRAQSWILDSGLALPSRESVLRQQVVRASGEDSELELSRAVFAGVGLAYATPFSFGPYGDSWMDPINEALSSVLVGGIPVEQALENAQVRYDQMTSSSNR